MFHVSDHTCGAGCRIVLQKTYIENRALGGANIVNIYRISFLNDQKNLNIKKGNYDKKGLHSLVKMVELYCR